VSPARVVFAAMLGALVLATGCGGGDGLRAVPGTTTRLEPSKSGQPGPNGLELSIMADADACYGLIDDPAERAACLPYVDRGAGQVRVSFQVRADSRNQPIPLKTEQVEVFHQNKQVQTGGANRVQLVPHSPRRSPQLFILVIDTSGSMNIDDNTGVTRMDRVRRALVRRDVVDAFFPPDNGAGSPVRTAVVPLVFSGSGVPQPLGGKLVVTSAEEYRTLIRDSLQTGKGYTFLYQSVAYAATTLLSLPEIKRAISSAEMQPTIIALTDGFNNETSADTCGSNAPRLTTLLKTLYQARREAPAGSQPELYTVGLGVPVWKTRAGDPPPPTDPGEVTATALCRNRGEEAIDGGIETRGVDNEALARMARVGGGDSYIRRDTDGLAEAFKAAAALRYGWFEMRYQVDPFYLRRAFVTKLKLLNLFGMEGEVKIHPSGWLDAPPGELDAEGWAHPAPFRESLRLLLPTLAALIIIGYLPAAGFNALRPFRARVGRRG